MTGGWGAGLRLLRPRDAICPARVDAGPAGLPGCRVAGEFLIIAIIGNTDNARTSLSWPSAPALRCEHCDPLAATAMHRYERICSDYAATMHRYSDSASTSGATNAMRMGPSSPPETCTLSP